MKIAVLGGDGFCGWPTSLHLSALGHEVTIVDNQSRRRIDKELGCDSLTPITSIKVRLAAWKELTGRTITFLKCNIATEHDEFKCFLGKWRPDALIHFAEQRSAPYSMKSQRHRRYTIDNNTNCTHNVLCALAELELDAHLVHLGTMGVYGYGTSGMKIPEGYLDIQVQKDDGATVHQQILYPPNPGSIYHTTKCMDQLLFQYYAKNDGVRITDLHQGIIWGTVTEETELDERLINRFDYDGDYGTVLNRFLMQAAVGHPLTVHGSGGQTRAFIHIRDMMRCITIALADPPARGERVRIFNQMTETHRVRELARMVSDLTGAEIRYTVNPRNEDDENNLYVKNDKFLKRGLRPIRLAKGLVEEVIEVARRYAYRCNLDAIPCRSAWNQEREHALAEDQSLVVTSQVLRVAQGTR